MCMMNSSLPTNVVCLTVLMLAVGGACWLIVVLLAVLVSAAVACWLLLLSVAIAGLVRLPTLAPIVGSLGPIATASTLFSCQGMDSVSIML